MLICKLAFSFYVEVGMQIDGENNCCISPTLEGWVYIVPTHGPLGGPLYIWAQYTPTVIVSATLVRWFVI